VRGGRLSLGFVGLAVLGCWLVVLGGRGRMASRGGMQLAVSELVVLAVLVLVPEVQHLVDTVSLLLEGELVEGELVVVVGHMSAVVVATVVGDEIVVDYCFSGAHIVRSVVAAVLRSVVPAGTSMLAWVKSEMVMVEAHRIVLAWAVVDRDSGPLHQEALLVEVVEVC
jgi:hypothetical protein